MGRLALLALFVLPQDPAPPKNFAADIDVAVMTLPNMPANPAVMKDLEFLYRVRADLLGQKPSDEEVRAFTADAAPDKRAKKVGELLASAKFGEFWAKRLAEAWIGDLEKVRMEKVPFLPPPTAEKIRDRFVAWLAEQLNQDRSYAEIVSDMVVARGKSGENPALGYKLSFYRGGGFPEEFSMGLSRGLLGIRLYCARCHDHPFDRWTVENHWGLAAFVAREKAERSAGGEAAELTVADSGELAIPTFITGEDPARKVKPAAAVSADPVFLFGGAANKTDDRSKVLAGLLTSKANTQLARAFVNRIWGWIFRRGIVHPVDDFNLRNKAASPKLLEALTQGFVGSGHSLKTLLREICRTRIYQVPDAAGPDEADVFYLRGVYRKPWPVRGIPKDLPKSAFPAGWQEDARVTGWPYFNYRIPDKRNTSAPARLWVAKGATPVEEAFRQLAGAKPKFETIQGKQEIKLGDATGTMHCDSTAGAPLENQRMIFARLGKGSGWTFRLEGPADTVADWRDEFIEMLKGIEP